MRMTKVLLFAGAATHWFSLRTAFYRVEIPGCRCLHCSIHLKISKKRPFFLAGTLGNRLNLNELTRESSVAILYRGISADHQVESASQLAKRCLSAPSSVLLSRPQYLLLPAPFVTNSPASNMWPRLNDRWFLLKHPF